MFPQPTISDCFKAIDLGDIHYAVVPFENSTNGLVMFTYDLIRDWFLSLGEQKKASANFKIVGEQFVSIHHNFLTNAKSLADIKTVYSHPQVWTQVSKFMSEQITSKITLIDTTSTSAAAEQVYNDKTNTTACISSFMSSKRYSLPIMFENIEDNHNNTTRFLILGNSELSNNDIYKGDKEIEQPFITSIIFTLNHNDPGALCSALDIFRKYSINMTTINSRPSHKAPWQYVFFIELIGKLDDENVTKSFKFLSNTCTDFAVLGTFKRSWRFWGS